MTDRRTLIIKNALHDINERGVVGASINTIAKESGISKATFFHYFTSKDELVNEVFLHCKVVFLDAPVKGALLYKFKEEDIVSMFEFYAEHREELTFINRYYYTDYISEEARKIAEKMFQDSREEIILAQQNGEIIKLDVTFILMFITNTCLNCLDDVFVDGKINLEYMRNVILFIKNALNV